MAFTDTFVPAISSCSEILNAGSALYVGKLVNCGDEPTVYTVEADTAIAINGTSASLAVTVPATLAQLRLRKGQRLVFGANSIVIAEDALLTNTASTVAIEPATAAVALNATATVWEMFKLLSPTALPIDTQSQAVNRTDLSFGLQGSEVKTKVSMTSQIEIIARPDDRAFWSVLFPASQNNDDVYAMIVRSGDNVHAFGRTKVMNLTMPGQIEEILRPSFSLNFQSPFAVTEPFSYLSTAKQTQLNAIRALVGLPALV